MITRDDWLSAVKEAREVTIPESDALTMQELASLLGLRRTATRLQLNTLISTGRAVKTTKQVRRLDGRVVVVPAYRLVEI